MLYVIIIAAVVIFWLVAVDRPVLKVKFKDGAIIQSKGHFPPSFKHNISEIGDVTAFDGELKVYQQRTGMKLVFSKQVPKKIQQRIRNVFPHQGFTSKESRTKKSH
ncbi:DUF3634 family protein [Vibrio sp. SA48]|uniref:DUF3634 family protein n=1 Tax=Vibrio sp. S12_S33 TaxID=2720223 RepID=UPI00178665CE|nr:DUF3634 family protein [Vibrio sp. S12_S33]MBD1564469.1 DUF3634 family protein [Vibrio sp. S12_S33]